MSEKEQSVERTQLQRALLTLREMRARLEAVERAQKEPIAIVGMSVRFPGAEDAGSFWQLLENGVCAITEVPPERWSLDRYYDPDETTPGKTYSRHGGFIAHKVDHFDPLFFGISPREAQTLDPQQRLLLELSWEALENSGIAPDSVSGKQVGVFFAGGNSDFFRLIYQDPELIDSYSGTGTMGGALVGRLSYFLGIHGPCFSVDTACSSSLVATHLAVQSLRNRESDMALAGGVNLLLTPEITLGFSKAQMISKSGLCRTFDADADGYVRAEGCGIIVLKRLSDAQADGDTILALIRGSAINQDGRSNGLTAPNELAQEACITAALANGGIAPVEVSYVEAHGTGTPLGDPIEVNGIVAALCRERAADRPLLIGSVKTNLGHLEIAAGIAGLVKVILALQHEKIPPHLHLKKPNPLINWSELPIRVTTDAVQWPKGNGRRVAGISSYGFGGTNAHIIVEEAPVAEPEPTEPDAERSQHLLRISARSDAALSELARRYEKHIAAHPEQSLADMAYTAGIGRTHFAHRLAIVAGSAAEAQEKLAAFSAGRPMPGVLTGRAGEAIPDVAFLFTGQGSQYANMGRQLYETQPTFRRVLDRCDEILRSYLERPLLAVMFPEPPQAGLLDETAYTQPALFALEYSLAELWRSWGIEPAAVMGHSVGEYVAACVAGVFSLEDALKLIALRGRLMQSLPREGMMAAVQAGETEVLAAIGAVLAADRDAAAVSVAATNSPRNTVISGESDAVEAAIEAFRAQGVKVTPLSVSHAFHSSLMEPILDAFEEAARSVTFHAPTIPLISNLDGRVIDDQVPGADYWRQHIRQGVRFARAMETLREEGFTSFLEIGPSPVLLGMGRECLPDLDAQWLPSLRKDRDDWQQLFTSLGTLYVQGAQIDARRIDSDYPRRKVSLPNYAFQKQYYWPRQLVLHTQGASPVGQDGSRPTGHPLLGRRLRSFLRETQFENTLSTAWLPFLDGHQIYSTVVVPGAAFMELAQAAAVAKFGPGAHRLERFTFQETMLLPEGEAKTIQVILAPEEVGRASLQLVSVTGEEQWKVHASGTIVAASEAGAPRTEPVTPPPSFHEVRARFESEIDVPLFYQKLREVGLNYGTGFQGVLRLWRGEDETLGEVQLPEGLISEAGDYHFHPALLDACLHPGLLHCTLPSLGRNLNGSFEKSLSSGDREAPASIYIPMGFERFSVYRPSPTRLWSYVAAHQVEGNEREVYTADMWFYDDSGQLVAEVAGMYLKRAPREALLRALKPSYTDWLYKIEWRQSAYLPADPRAHEAPGNWLVFGLSPDSGQGAGNKLVERLRAAGGKCVLVEPGPSYGAVEEGRWHVRPSHLPDFELLLRDAAPSSEGWHGIVYMWAAATLPADEISVSSLIERQEVGVTGALHLVQALARQRAMGTKGPVPRLWLVTRGAQPVEDGYRLAPEQAPVWGMGKTIALELPELRCVRIDLEPGPAANNDEMLFNALWADDGEEQIAFRGGTRYLARLVRAGEKTHGRPSGAYELSISERGVLDNLVLQPSTRRKPSQGEVEIAVHATGLNFRDVLKALGMYPGDPGWFGDECAGQVVAVGDGVAELEVGDRVFGIAKGSFSRYVTTPAELLVPIPAHLTYDEAATIPTTFLTAYYALQELGKISAGDRVLIHAAAGGVGVAATQLALRAGAEVFATASPGKWAFLHSLGVRHVMNSRTLDFADEVLALTKGAGVDVVLNSLNGEFIAKSLAALAPKGRFLEIGKVGIWDQDQVAEVRPEAAYHIIFLDEVREQEPVLFRTMLRTVADGIADGSLQPLPHHLFPIEKISAAFRFMAQAKHVGKIVVTQPAASDAARPAVSNGEGAFLHEDATYLITGGLGGLGLSAARWMGEQGARHLVLVGRSEPSEAAQAVLDELQETGVSVVVAHGDVSCYDDMARILSDIEQSLPPLRGILHTAGVLDDGILLEQNWSRFARVMAPKVDGAWYLHLLTRQVPLDFFVLYSSIASVVGSAGQANYVGANTFMDVLAAQRYRQGRAALSVSWGPWAEVGMIAGLGPSVQQRWARSGMELIRPEQGVQVLEQLVGTDLPHVAAAPMEWVAYLRSLNRPDPPPFLGEIARHVQPGVASQKREQQDVDLVAQLAQVEADERGQLVVDHIRNLARMVFALPPDYVIDQRQSFNELGLDSLMAVEMGNALGRSTKSVLPPTVLFDYPTLETLSAHLLNDVLGMGPDVAGSGSPEKAKEREQPAADVDSLSEEEATALLIAELSQINDEDGGVSV